MFAYTSRNQQQLLLSSLTTTQPINSPWLPNYCTSNKAHSKLGPLPSPPTRCLIAASAAASGSFLLQHLLEQICQHLGWLRSTQVVPGPQT